jgi:hypothetical protein
MAAVLYLVTAFATAVPVVLALGWAVWGAPVSPLEGVSLCGSFLLAVGGLVSVRQRRFGARIALAGLAGIWLLYLTTLVGLARIRLSDQRLDLQVVYWLPSSSALTIVDPLKGTRGAISDEDIQILKSLPLKGKIENAGRGESGNGRRQGRVVIVLERPVDVAAALAEPDGVSVAYVQRKDGWDKYPPDARTLSRSIRLQPSPPHEPKYTDVLVEQADGSGKGFGVVWH